MRFLSLFSGLASWSIYYEFSQNVVGNTIVSIYVSDGTNTEGFYLNGTGISLGGATNIYGSSLALNTFNKVMLTYNGTQLKWYTNGTLIGIKNRTLGTINSAYLANQITDADFILKVKNLTIYPSVMNGSITA